MGTLDRDNGGTMKCWWGFLHNWGKWKVTRSASIMQGLDKTIIGFWKEQERECEECGKIELRSIQS